jgi:hypothetical protein
MSMSWGSTRCRSWQTSPFEQFTVHYDEWTSQGIREPFEPTETAVLISVDKRDDLNTQKEP